MLSISDVLLIKFRCENDIYFSLWVCLAPLRFYYEAFLMPEIMKLIECLVDALILLSLLIFQVASDDVVILNFIVVGKRIYFCIKILLVVFLAF